MPFTPFHFGPGAAIKALAPRRFSFSVFCFSQVVTDCETLYYMVQGLYPWHRFFHTYVGATLIAILSILVGRPISQLCLRIWAQWRGAPFKQYFPHFHRYPLEQRCRWRFYRSLQPRFPRQHHASRFQAAPALSAANPLYLLVGPGILHLICFVLGLIGAFYVASRNRNA